ncbi:MAG TPA: crosslink repair DNA glycosylase YcaQ family protein, partial [Nitrososphaerales archaeon]|nr:crosslink repair DNA glycosylase YcaQ family protein [Nitrososphaerales archaeon]
MNLTSGQVSAWRMKKQHLARRKKKGELARVVSDVCGVQAQVLSAAELGLRARVEGLHQEDVRRALWADHTLVKIWSMRGTLHLLAVADLPLYLAGLRTRLLESKLWLGDNLGVSAREVDLITEEIGRILSKSQLTREELALEVEKRLSLRPEVTKHLRS